MEAKDLIKCIHCDHWTRREQVFCWKCGRNIRTAIEREQFDKADLEKLTDDEAGGGQNPAISAIDKQIMIMKANGLATYLW